jgi:hypothetical protein
MGNERNYTVFFDKHGLAFSGNGFGSLGIPKDR